MRNFNSVAFVLSAAICIGLANGRPHYGGRVTRDEIGSALRAGKRVILVVAPRYDKSLDSDEAYGDWADQFNYFTAHVSKDVKVMVLTKAKYVETVDDPKIKGSYGTLFLLNSTHALLYDGAILEREIYEIGISRNEPDEKAVSTSGLQKVSFHLK